MSETVARARDLLRSSGRWPERIVSVRLNRRPAGRGPDRNQAHSWVVVDRELGLGWYLGRFRWRSPDGTPAGAHLTLSDTGSLFCGSSIRGEWDERRDGQVLRVRPGRYLARFHKPILAVDPAGLDLERCDDDSLRQLVFGISEAGAGRFPVADWGTKP